MANAPEQRTNIPRQQFDFTHQPETDQSFENALDKARSGERLTVADGVELMTTGSDQQGIDPKRKEAVLGRTISTHSAIQITSSKSLSQTSTHLPRLTTTSRRSETDYCLLMGLNGANSATACNHSSIEIISWILPSR